jgi:hypothetical protein
LYPLTREIRCATGVSSHLNLSEQRWKRAAPLSHFVLNYSSMTAAETVQIRNFFDSQKGSFDTWDFVLGRALTDGVISSDGTLGGGTGTTLASPTNSFSSLDVGKDVVVEGAGPGGSLFMTTITAVAGDGSSATVASGGFIDGGTAAIRVGKLYRNMALEHDTLPMLERESTLYNFTLTARQTANPTFTLASPGSAYPNLAIGLKAQRPYTRVQRYAVLRNDNVFGPRYSWAWVGGGLSGFPGNALHGWQLDYPVLSDTDLATLESFFLSHFGRFQAFSFTDPDDGNTYSDVRFDSDSLEIHHEQIGVSSLSVKLLGTNEMH